MSKQQQHKYGIWCVMCDVKPLTLKYVRYG